MRESVLSDPAPLPQVSSCDYSQFLAVVNQSKAIKVFRQEGESPVDDVKKVSSIYSDKLSSSASGRLCVLVVLTDTYTVSSLGKRLCTVSAFPLASRPPSLAAPPPMPNALLVYPLVAATA